MKRDSQVWLVTIRITQDCNENMLMNNRTMQEWCEEQFVGCDYGEVVVESVAQVMRKPAPMKRGGENPRPTGIRPPPPPLPPMPLGNATSMIAASDMLEQLRRIQQLYYVALRGNFAEGFIGGIDMVKLESVIDKAEGR
jgi:hypothetical protein